MKFLRLFNNLVTNSVRTFCSIVNPQICIVGGGPAGFYAAQQLVKLLPTAVVDIYERLPVPFGLVRYGVAPDHPEVKNVINTFTKTAKNPRVNFLGNVSLGEDITLEDLESSYHAILLTYGAEEDSKLNIKGETLPNVISARQFVGWYNGVPSDANLKVNLDVEDVVVIGQGNVAVDVARILLTPVDKLKVTDITDYALQQLAQSKVKNVSLVGRRGPLQVALTIKELRELLRLPDVKMVFNKRDFIGLENVIPDLPRPRKRLTELLYKSALEDPAGTGSKSLRFVFQRAPLSFKGDQRVERLKTAVTRLVTEGGAQRALPTAETEVLPCGLALRSIGYRSTQVVPTLPFDKERGVAINENGKIGNGLYCSGWVCTGPVGVILSTMTNAFTTAQHVHQDWVDKAIDTTVRKPGSSHVVPIVESKGIQVVSFEGWEKINQEEEERGKKMGKPREKIVKISEMLHVAR